MGDGDIDHAWCGRPEDMTMDRPAYRLTDSAPGSDLAAEMAAAMAAASILYQSTGTLMVTMLGARYSPIHIGNIFQ